MPVSGLFSSWPAASSVRLWLAALAVGGGLAWACGSRLDTTALAWLIPLLGVGVAVRQRGRAVRVAGHAVFVCLAAALALHLLPGTDNVCVPLPPPLPGAPAAGFHLNLDKPWIGVWLLLACPWVVRTTDAGRACRTVLTLAPLTLAVCLGLASALGAVAWAPGWPAVGLLWAANNLLLVCVTEELLFRGYLQGAWMRRWPTRPVVPVLLSAAVFGLAHAGGGWAWAMLGGLAGLGYGWAFLRGGLAASVAVHFLVNLAHFAGWTYPALPVPAS
ncbi:CPBP family intramembrane metalloprotease [Verticiella sediminum]|uniref:CPBP family intramembrane metalloprotease n=1 Tax=Verticiella sediminum TaxID=1247510 RepID=A0A556AKD9_9BURK|nr:CPBP family intramembrane glutamic endopeptidase [Verticiella sediminum]TSH93359.1 CPBP family intramembrane metalloprotease [Verticiella sediminum]